MSSGESIFFKGLKQANCLLEKHEPCSNLPLSKQFAFGNIPTLDSPQTVQTFAVKRLCDLMLSGLLLLAMERLKEFHSSKAYIFLSKMLILFCYLAFRNSVYLIKSEGLQYPVGFVYREEVSSGFV